MKTCTKCGEVKPISDYYKDGSRAGTRNTCKSCQRIINREVAAKPENKEKKRAYKVSTREAHKERSRQYRARNSDKNRDRVRKWQTLNKHKVAAHNAVNQALAAGRIVSRACEICKNEDAMAHHDDYSKKLDLVWLCHVHHAARHAAIRARGGK